MARTAITEYASKKLVLGDQYTGFSVKKDTVDETVEKLSDKSVYIVKIDVGIKKRGKQGLIRLSVSKKEVKKAVEELCALGHKRCVIEEMVPHETKDERYVSIDLVREGALVLYSDKGGVEIEDNHDDIQRFLVPRAEMFAGTASKEVPELPLNSLLASMQNLHISFLEINPFITVDGEFTPLDMAMEIDDSKLGKLPEWVQEHVINRTETPQEEAVHKQANATSAALTLKTLNKNGSILTLLSGGGASLVAMDTLVGCGLQHQIINYSEYSGAPTKDETQAYARTLLEVLFESNAEKKVILIAGGVANFTDIMTTFEGLVSAFEEKIVELQQQNVYVCVRRGGPNQEKGLAYMREFLSKNSISHDVYGPELSLSEVGTLIKKHL